MFIIQSSYNILVYVYYYHKMNDNKMFWYFVSQVTDHHRVHNSRKAKRLCFGSRRRPDTVASGDTARRLGAGYEYGISCIQLAACLVLKLCPLCCRRTQGRNIHCGNNTLYREDGWRRRVDMSMKKVNFISGFQSLHGRSYIYRSVDQKNEARTSISLVGPNVTGIRGPTVAPTFYVSSVSDHRVP